MTGTKMTLHRYSGSSQDWKEQLIVVDQAYLATNSRSLIHLIYPYEMGSNLLEVFYNGQRLSLGGGYSEVDNETIELSFDLYEEDEVVIKYWENHYYSRGASTSSTDISQMQKTIDEILTYGGASNLDMEYQYNEEGKIIAEIATGDYNIERHFTYNSIDEVETEKIIFNGRVVEKSYVYDLSTYKLLKTTVRVIS